MANRLVEEHDLMTIAHQYAWHLDRMSRRPVDKPGALLATAIAENRRPPRGHPDERWFREEHPYAYLGEVSRRAYAPKARGGGRKTRRTANKGSKTAAVIVPGGLHFGAKHGALGKEKRQHRDKQGLKD